MVSLIVPAVFFCMLVLVYPVAAMVLAISAWMLKRWESKQNVMEETIGEMIDKKTDELKDIMFNILVFLLFFFVSPFVAFYMAGLIK